uniref:Ribosome recycling factor domain-containing protein n=1 Tax=Heterosigma akashiwo TaxID=2829 RepID=A0A7S4D6T5_HETAK
MHRTLSILVLGICLVVAASFSLVGSSSTFVQRSSTTEMKFSYHSTTRNMLSMEAGDFDTKGLMKDAEKRMKKSLESLVDNLNTIRTGRASPAILDRVNVMYYEVETPLNQLAGISTSSATQLVVSPYDKSALKDIERAILESGIGLTPNNDGDVIRLNIPPLTEERRKELSKDAKAIGEEGKVAVRNIRRDVVDKVKKAEKANDLSKDQSKDGQDEAQKLTDKYTKKVDEVVAEKEADIMKI